MKGSIGASALVLALLLGAPVYSAPGGEDRSWIHVPESSLESPFDVGVRVHTNHRIHLQPAGGPDSWYGGLFPRDLWRFYGMPGTGGSGVIAIVVAYHYPTALADFNAFSAQFGLPQEPSTNPTSSTNAVFQVVYQGGSKPKENVEWAQEAALDIEWAHAMAPQAKILLIEAKSNATANLLASVNIANKRAGVKQVSMSWGSSEFSGENSKDSYFKAAGRIYFAASGDIGGWTSWPSVSRYVVAVGGTKVTTINQHEFASESGWSGSGGGTSLYVPKPAWQPAGVGGSKRSVPDVSSVADPSSGVAVLHNGSWMVFGGTSVSAPCVAGMSNVTGSVGANTTDFLTQLYANYSSGAPHFRDITSGGTPSFQCGPGWDFVTGVGVPAGILP